MFRFIFTVIARLFRIGASQTDVILRRLERTVPVMERARTELFNKAVEVKKSATLLEGKLDGIEDMKTKERIQCSITKLNEHARYLAEQHELYEGRLAEFKARKYAAEVTLTATRALHGVGDRGDALQLLKDMEQEIAEIEAEADAVLYLTNGR